MKQKLLLIFSKNYLYVIVASQRKIMFRWPCSTLIVSISKVATNQNGHYHIVETFLIRALALELRTIAIASATVAEKGIEYCNMQ